ncbi:hypothetical protein [Acinetobacter sp.]|uniref:hypothetical protein n=1 Tax=Acinetobacter sp. TaxID=472 RepID=UPI0031DB47E1
MLIYIIPFVLLLVIAIVLKKRASNQQNNDTKKAQPLKGNQKAKLAKGKEVSHSTVTATTEVAEPPANQKAEVNPEFRRRIETLIQEQNFGTAEALLNQELNQNKDQHDLYLLLLDIHLKQQDDFGVTQLLNHLRSLGLFDLVRLAEQKCALEKVKSETVQHTPVQLQESVETTHQVKPNTDTLSNVQNVKTASSIDFPSVTDSSSSKIENLNSEPNVKSDVKPDVAPIDFDFNFSDLAKTEAETKPTPEPEKAAAPLDFKLSLEPQSVETKGAHNNTPQATIAPALEFDLATPDLQIETDSKETKTSQIQQDAPTEVNHSDFKFDFKTTEPSSLTADAEPVQLQPEASVEQASTFTFDLPVADVAPAAEIAPEPIAVETPVVFETATPVMTETVVAPVISDPILLQFPELTQMKETELDLRLAEQYIKLGAFDAARHLLTAQTKFDPEESDQAKKLLNQIAS